MRHWRQCPQFTCISALTKSPAVTAVTSSPTFSTTPQNSCPSVTGGLIRPWDQRSHPYICKSVPQIDAVRTRTSTSVGPMTGTVVLSSESPRAACTLRKAFMVVVMGRWTLQMSLNQADIHATTCPAGLTERTPASVRDENHQKTAICAAPIAHNR